jgi:hypothetical protein
MSNEEKRQEQCMRAHQYGIEIEHILVKQHLANQNWTSFLRKK